MKTVAEIRENIYDYHRKYYSYIFEEWKWYSYRKFKAKLYMNVCPCLVYLFMKMKTKPNTVTIVYALLGILGGVLLAIPVKWVILAGIAIFYFRPFLDWADGPLARETKQTSITGDILDNYGALTGWVALWIGLGLYLAFESDESVFFYLTPVIPAIFALNIVTAARNILYSNYIVKGVHDYIPKKQDPDAVPVQAGSQPATKHATVVRIVGFVNRIFEHNARFVDLICLVILLELFLPFFVSWLIFLAFLLWQILLFFAILYTVARGGWVEQELQNKLEQIHKEDSAL